MSAVKDITVADGSNNETKLAVAGETTAGRRTIGSSLGHSGKDGTAEDITDSRWYVWDYMKQW